MKKFITAFCLTTFVACGPLSPEQMAKVEKEQTSKTGSITRTSSTSGAKAVETVTIDRHGEDDIEYSLLSESDSSVLVVITRRLDIARVRVLHLTQEADPKLFELAKSLVAGDLKVNSASCSGVESFTVSYAVDDGNATQLTCPRITDPRYPGLTFTDLSNFVLKHL